MTTSQRIYRLACDLAEFTFWMWAGLIMLVAIPLALLAVPIAAIYFAWVGEIHAAFGWIAIILSPAFFAAACIVHEGRGHKGEWHP